MREIALFVCLALASCALNIANTVPPPLAPIALEDYPTAAEVQACQRAYGYENMPGYFRCRAAHP